VIITDKQTSSYVVFHLFYIIQYFYWLIFKFSNLNTFDTRSTPHTPKTENIWKSFCLRIFALPQYVKFLWRYITCVSRPFHRTHRHILHYYSYCVLLQSVPVLPHIYRTCKNTDWNSEDWNPPKQNTQDGRKWRTVWRGIQKLLWRHTVSRYVSSVETRVVTLTGKEKV